MYKYIFLIVVGTCTLPLFSGDTDKNKNTITSARKPDRPDNSNGSTRGGAGPSISDMVKGLFPNHKR